MLRVTCATYSSDKLTLSKYTNIRDIKFKIVKYSGNKHAILCYTVSVSNLMFNLGHTI